MTRRVLFVVLGAAALAFPTPALAHGGGHKGGCEDFGRINRAIGSDPASFGFPGFSNLGDLVSYFAALDDAEPGVGDIVESVDHQACG